MEKTRFVPWDTMADRIVRGTGCTYSEALQTLASSIGERSHDTGELRDTSYTHLSVEASWVLMCGRAYFKVYPGIARMLCHTSNDIPVEMLRPNYVTMNVQLPADDCPIPIVNGTMLASISPITELREASYDDESMRAVVQRVRKSLQVWERKNGLEVGGLMMLIYQTPEDVQDGTISTTTFYLIEGQTVAFSLDRFIEIYRDDSILNRSLSDEHLRAIVSIVCGVCCFASGQTDLLAPDLRVEPPKPRQKRHGRAAEALERMEAEREAKRHAKALERCRGWHVGREIELPRWHHTSEGEGESREGHALSYSHIRSGHLRMQACGPRLQERKVVFIRPTIIRPDLPASPHPRGFKITDRVLG